MLMAYEDRRFARHPGIDPAATLRAAWQWLARGRIVSGGSTLTMQVARLLEPRAERSLAAKLRQMVRAVAARAALRQGRSARPLPRARALWRHGRGRARGQPRLFRPRAGPPLLRRGGAARRPAAIARDAPARPLPRARPARARPRARPGRRRTGVDHRGRGRGRPGRAGARPRRKPFPMLAAHAAEAALRGRARRRRSIRLTIDGRLQASLEALAAERAAALGPGSRPRSSPSTTRTGEVRAQVGSPGYLDAEPRAAPST